MARTMDVVPYDENWVILYEKEKRLLENVFGDLILDIQHFGSTSVFGLSAKPIIDIMVIVSDINAIDNYNDVMESQGYNVRGESGIPGRRYFVRMKDDNSGNHTHHIHVYGKDNGSTQDYLMFRDYLRINEEALREYENVKKELSVKYNDSPSKYTNGKEECVSKVMEKARLYFAQ